MLSQRRGGALPSAGSWTGPPVPRPWTRCRSQGWDSHQGVERQHLGMVVCMHRECITHRLGQSCMTAGALPTGCTAQSACTPALRACTGSHPSPLPSAPVPSCGCAASSRTGTWDTFEPFLHTFCKRGNAMITRQAVTQHAATPTQTSHTNCTPPASVLSARFQLQKRKVMCEAGRCGRLTCKSSVHSGTDRRGPP